MELVVVGHRGYGVKRIGNTAVVFSSDDDVKIVTVVTS